MNGATGRNEDRDAFPLLSARLFCRVGISLAAFGMLAAIAACQQPQMEEKMPDEVPVEVPDEVPDEVPVEVPDEVPVGVPDEAFIEVPVEQSGCELPELPGRSKYVVEAWPVPDSEFNVGEPLRIQMRVSTPAYMNIFHVSTSCKVTRLLHNHAIADAEIVDFPLPESGLQMTVKPPAGQEAFYFVATRSPMEFLSGSDILNETLGIASLDLSPAQFFQRLNVARGRTNPDDWSAKTLLTSVIDH